MITVRRLVWDDWNVAHIALHGVTPEDIEEVCQGEYLVRQSYQGRFLMIGTNASGKLLSAVLAPEEEGIYYVVTARPAAKQERRIYRQFQGDERK
jgi:uncharacterized DUF497 family protein